MMALYRKEGVNPVGGCLPLVLQMPIFFALFELLNNAFDLRGAPFIAPWIGDLSAPESLLPFGFTLPLLNWDELRILPFVMLGTTLLQSRISQNPSAVVQPQMKMMMYAMPIFFFFILYSMPSGLVIYWTMQNVLSIAQQLYINDRRRRAGPDSGTASAGRGPRGKSR
jgi:YidC/Oxa1 family membrane protein insertase